MENVFNRVLIRILVSGIAVCSPVIAETAAPPISSTKSQTVPRDSDHHKMIQESSEIVASQGVNLHIPTQLPSSEENKLSQYGPWVTENGISSNAQQLIHAIQNATIHGLNPEAYDLTNILRTTDALTTLSTYVSNNSIQVADLLSRDIKLLRTILDRQLNAAFSQLTEHLGQGVVDARAAQKRLFRKAPIVNAQVLLEDLKTGSHTVSSALNSVVPAHPEYQRLTERMRNLLMEQTTGASRGLSVTSAAEERTHVALNLSIADEIEAVALSLERWRWMPRDLGRKHILINIPEYRAVVRSESQSVLSMDVVVGSVKYQTPAFSRDMSYMDFNPTWMVPQSIANRDLIPLERRQPGYLASRNFDLLKREGDKLIKISLGNITSADLEQGRFPYILRQRSGSGNVLGKVKFMMPNPYRIYLHDTPTKKHFMLDDRAFSNGCIRLSEPERLARLLMLGDGYTQGDVVAASSSVATKRIKLRTPIPTHITYLTTWVDKNNLLHRRADIYGYDAALVIALQASNTLLSTIMSHPVVSTNAS